MQRRKNAVILIIAAALVCSGLLCAPAHAAPTSKYVFTTDWFSAHIPVWQPTLRHLQGKKAAYLEIGVWEGRSFFWVLDNILTNPQSRAVAIDYFPGEAERRFQHNLKESGHAKKVTVLKGPSYLKLRELKPNTFDLVYIDGDHIGAAVLKDIMLCWDLIKDGGLLILDDYQWGRGDLPADTRPEFAIDAFITLFWNQLDIVHSGYQMIVQKTKKQDYYARGYVKRMDDTLYSSRFGQYVYYWKPQKLFDARNREITLREGEAVLIERLLGDIRLGLRAEARLGGMDEYDKLFKRLYITNIFVTPAPLPRPAKR
jgi:hypothetical protein